MSRNLTASDRSRLIRLASKMEKGSPERKAILAGLKGASTKTASVDDIHDTAVAMRKAVRALFVNAEKLERLFKKYPVLDERDDGFPQRYGEDFEKSLDDIIKVMEREVWPRVSSLETYASGFMFRGDTD